MNERKMIMDDWMKILLGTQLIREVGRLSDTFMSASGNFYYVDSNNTFDHGYETMVFACNNEGEVTDWKDLDCKRYHSLEEMQAGHKAMVEKWKAK